MPDAARIFGVERPEQERQRKQRQETQERPLGSVVQEIRDDLKDFIAVRLTMLRSELGAGLSAWKQALPFMAAGALFLATTWLLLTGALVALIAIAVGWGWSFLIVAVLYGILGASVAWLGYKEITAVSLKPERTLKVLKQDQIWIQNEARSA